MKKLNSMSDFNILNEYDITKYNNNKYNYKNSFNNIGKPFENVGKYIGKAMTELEVSKEYIKIKAEHKKRQGK